MSKILGSIIPLRSMKQIISSVLHIVINLDQSIFQDDLINRGSPLNLMIKNDNQSLFFNPR